jgi:hypothetical protein
MNWPQLFKSLLEAWRDWPLGTIAAFSLVIGVLTCITLVVWFFWWLLDASFLKYKARGTVIAGVGHSDGQWILSGRSLLYLPPATDVAFFVDGQQGNVRVVQDASLRVGQRVGKDLRADILQADSAKRLAEVLPHSFFREAVFGETVCVYRNVRPP